MQAKRPNRHSNPSSYAKNFRNSGRYSGKVGLALEVLKRIPKPQISRANIAITYRCNQKCTMCNIWKHNKEQDIDKELDVNEIQKIIVRNNLIWVSLTGGEPFLSRWIINILTMSMLYCRLVSIVTNGSKPDLIYETVRDALRRSDSLLVFSISLEGDRETHDRITGTKGSYDKVIEAIEKLKHVYDKRFILGIEHVLMGQNDAAREHVKHVAKEYQIGLTYTLEQRASYYHNKNGITPGIIEKPKYKLSVKPLDMMHNLFLRGMRKDNRKLCEAGKYSVFIDPYANLSPCLLRSNHVSKNLRDTDYIIGDIKKDAQELFKTCKAPCYTPCEVYACMLFRPWRLL